MNAKVIETPDEEIMDNLGSKTDVESDELTEFSKPYNARDEMMAQVVKSAVDGRNDVDDEDFEDINPLDVDEDEGGEPEPIAETLKKDSTESLDNSDSSTDNLIIERDGKQFIKLILNGVETEMPADAAIEVLQKNENAERLSWEATQTKQKYDSLIAQHEQQATLSEDARLDPAVDTQEALKEALTKVYDGDVEDGAELLARALNKSQAPAQEPADIRSSIVKVVTEIDDHKELNTAYTKFMANTEFKSVTEDDVLLGRVNAFTENLQKDPEFLATNPSYDDYFRKAAELTIAWVANLKSPDPISDTNDVDLRLERKRLAPSQPSSRTVRRGVKDSKTPTPPTNAEIIRSMAVKRGQNTY